jgi:6-pyruvoyltetrahydropterin/6-carboxytetrahydropterin synthase
MKAYLTRRYLFSASHRLHSPDMSVEENQAVYGKCNNPHGHGHNYALEVTVAGQVAPATGMVCNLVDLDGFVLEKILQRFDHQNLNTLAEFHETVPTTENLCKEIYDILHKDFRHAEVDKVRVEETMLNSFAYAGGREIRD